jgi:mannitol/fructose-specific phosphotransferase system IIA component
MAYASILVASMADIREAMTSGLTGSVIVIPFGADPTTPCRYFCTTAEITEEDLAALLEIAYFHQDERVLHAIWIPHSFEPESVWYQVDT